MTVTKDNTVFNFDRGAKLDDNNSDAMDLNGHLLSFVHSTFSTVAFFPAFGKHPTVEQEPPGVILLPQSQRHGEICTARVYGRARRILIYVNLQATLERLRTRGLSFTLTGAKK
ncbi:hypothetical protein EG328_005921 [Venturia inaequalis]|uniref:Uncharacterized protein n=1 Tax=Venturia inaequalis TaxID=5025 RepID=A0A8H3UHY5_VENIN|nr:hypothetical protein EG328_005921 [Venturia inaequalis]KAE9971955.1 hypothetical protein EG327_009674 [Venturia inaequalis]